MLTSMILPVVVIVLFVGFAFWLAKYISNKDR